MNIGQFEFKHYQTLALQQLSAFLGIIKETDLSTAWFKFSMGKPDFREWQTRRNGLGSSIPHGCIMLPTGGGKTLVGACAVQRIQHEYLQTGKGLVLWVVPSQTIYKQTLKTFRDVTSPLHQVFKGCADGNSPKILEKTDKLSPRDIQNTLCIMVVTLQSFNVKASTKEGRKLYNGNSVYQSFFPPYDDILGHRDLKNLVPNLDTYNFTEKALYVDKPEEYPEIKPSLANVFKLTQPLVVIDECHKSKTIKAIENINHFNPRFILELSATPFDNSNILYQAMGRDLWREQMIKLPIHLHNGKDLSWQQCLQQAYEKRRALESSALEMTGRFGEYLRPILLVRVQRTGKDQRDAQFIHAQDVKEWLLQKGVPEHEIAIRSSEDDDLGGRDLMSASESIRYIITKDALREGWDCPFAYVLCNLDNTHTDVSMVQMLGRILRQPNAKRFESHAELNEAFVYCYHAKVNELTDTVIKGLEKQGLGNLKNALISEGDTQASFKHTLKKRDKFIQETVILPTVLFHPRKAYNNQHAKEFEELNWTNHLLPFIDFKEIEVCITPHLEKLQNIHCESTLLGFYKQNKKGEDTLGYLQGKMDLQYIEPEYPSPHALYRLLYPVVPNAFVAHQLLGDSIESIRTSSMPYQFMASIKAEIESQVYQQSEALFRDWLSKGILSFEIVEQSTKKQGHLLKSEFDVSTQEKESEALSFENALYEPMLSSFFNQSEKSVAGYLDEDKTIVWWHRLFQSHQYKLQGWQKNVIYPDFLIKQTVNELGKTEYMLLEAKGKHLLDNPDTEYKKALLEVLEKNYRVIGTFKTPQTMRNLVLPLKEGWEQDLQSFLNVNHRIRQAQ